VSKSSASTVQIIITASTLACAGAAAWASADSLLRLATEAGVNPAFAIPVSIDGAGTVAAFSLLLGHAKAGRASRAYATGIVGLMVVVSAAANFLSAQGIELTGAERGWVSVIPPVSLALVLHLALGRAAGATTSTARRSVVRAKGSSASSPLGSSKVGPVEGDSRAAVITWARAERAAGRTPSGVELGLRLGKSRKTGARLRSELLLEKSQ
jgi:hypothetical protein